MRITIVGLMFVLVLTSACSKSGSDGIAPRARINQAPPAAGALAADAALGAAFNSGDLQKMFDLSLHPGATIVHAIDPHTLTPSQVKFGIAPRRDPNVEYQRDVILMENGDKAILSIASDGLTWTFDADAPQVSDFQEGKIVFATGRAIGRVLDLRKQGKNIVVILGPVQITDVIRNGSFAMDEPITLDNMIAYAAPDYPQPPVTDESKTTGLYGLRDRLRPHLNLPDQTSGRFLLAGLQLTPGLGQKLQTPTNYVEDITSAQPAINDPPSVEIQDMTSSVFSTSSGVGMQLQYNKNGLNVRTTSQISIRNAGLSFFLDIKGGVPVTFGLQLKGAAGVLLAMDASATQDFKVNLHKTLYVPIDLSIPLGGPVPLSLSFTQSFTISSGFSARTSVLNAKGDYGFSGGIVAGCWHGSCRASTPTEVHATTDLGQSAQGISVGINSLLMGASIRALVGLGGFGFSTGVYGGLRFTGTVLRAPDIAFPCRQGTIETYIDSGIGYSIPAWVSAAINFFLSPFTKHRIDAAGSIIKGPSLRLFHGNTQIPGKCATPNGGAAA